MLNLCLDLSFIDDVAAFKARKYLFQIFNNILSNNKEHKNFLFLLKYLV